MIKKKPTAREGVRDWRKPVRVDGPAAATEPACHLVVGFDRYPASHVARCPSSWVSRCRCRRICMSPTSSTLTIFRSNRTGTIGKGASSTRSSGNGRRRAPCSPKELELLQSYYSHEGNPAHLLATIADANDALMIIIGNSRGGLVSGIERVVGESVSSHLIHHGLGPVVLVPEHASAPRDRRPGAE